MLWILINKKVWSWKSRKNVNFSVWRIAVLQARKVSSCVQGIHSRRREGNIKQNCYDNLMSYTDIHIRLKLFFSIFSFFPYLCFLFDFFREKKKKNKSRYSAVKLFVEMTRIYQLLSFLWGIVKRISNIFQIVISDWNTKF